MTTVIDQDKPVYTVNRLSSTEFVIREQGTENAIVVNEATENETYAQMIQDFQDYEREVRKQAALKVVAAPVTGAKLLLRGLGRIGGSIVKSVQSGYSDAQPFVTTAK